MVNDIGATARGLLLQNRTAKTTGVISHGAFLSFPDDWVIFLSAETNRGPLTLNSSLTRAAAADLQLGDRVEVDRQSLYFPRSGIVVNWASAADWQAPELPSGWLSDEEQKSRLIELAARLLSTASRDGLICLLPKLLDLPIPDGCAGSASFANLQLRSIQLNLAAPTSDYAERLTDSLAPFIGLGRGLTPSGDDLIIGFLLALNRWGRWLHPGLEIEPLNRLMIEQARQRTTALSASLIRCAAAGQADESLVFALDSCLAGEWDLSACITALRSWGSSSGVDAFVGMLLAVSNKL